MANKSTRLRESDMSFSGKVVLVTGASSGIGREVAQDFAKHSAILAITGRDKDELNSTELKCRNNRAADVLQIIADFTNQQEVESVVDKVVQKYNRLDILINNAGAYKLGDLQTSTVEDFDMLFTVNVKSLFVLTQKAMPHLVASKGNIVNVSSIAGLQAFEGVLLYSMTKAAVDQFTKCVARECAPKGVRVNSVNPAFVKTNITRSAGLEGDELDAFYERKTRAHPIGRLGTTKEISRAILFLASDDSAWTTGNTFLIDGGRSLTLS